MSAFAPFVLRYRCTYCLELLPVDGTLEDLQKCWVLLYHDLGDWMMNIDSTAFWVVVCNKCPLEVIQEDARKHATRIAGFIPSLNCPTINKLDEFLDEKQIGVDVRNKLYDLVHLGDEIVV